MQRDRDGRARRCDSQPTMLADEINRRLSRLGISFNRLLRISHPYDPVSARCAEGFGFALLS